MKNKRAAMEMSVGTIVTIVLLMSMLVLGLILTKDIFSGATGAIKLTDQQVTKQINEIYAGEDGLKLIVYPQTRKIEIKQGKSDEFAFAISNQGQDEKSFYYKVEVSEIADSCRISENEAENLIQLGRSKDNIILGSGEMSIAFRTRITIPEEMPLCKGGIRYAINVFEGSGSPYKQSDMDIIIK